MVAERQQRVLDALPKGSFQARRRYQSLAGFAGSARPAAIDALSRRSDVATVYLDGLLWPACPLCQLTLRHAAGGELFSKHLSRWDGKVRTERP